MQYRVFALLGGSLILAMVACGESADDPEPSNSSSSGDLSSSSGGSSSGSASDAGQLAVTIATPRNDTTTQSRVVHVTGSVPAGSSANYVLGDATPAAIDVAADGSFAFDLDVAPGPNQLVVNATDADGATGSTSTNVHYGHRISGGNSQSIMIYDGAVYTWGRNERGQLGNGSFASSYYVNENNPLPDTLPSFYKLDLQNVISVASRQTFTLALLADHSVLAWGDNGDGQLGFDTSAQEDKVNVPTPMPGATNILALVQGLDHTLLLRADGSVLATGKNDHGQLGDGTTESRNALAPVPGLPSDLVQLAAGTAASYALTRDGHVWAWGTNALGQLGIGAADTNAHPTPVEVPGLSGVVEIEASDTVVVRFADGTLKAWGHNNRGQVGNGTTDSPVVSPVAVLGTDNQPVREIENIAADGLVSVALTTSGRVLAWGFGGLGQLGQGFDSEGQRDLENRTVATPLAVTEADAVVLTAREIELAAGGPTFAVTYDNHVYGWGWSFRGSLGRRELKDAWAYSAPILVFPEP